jgi:hypothetical protein
MNKIVYLLALATAMITFVLCTIQGISVVTTLFRTAIVYIGVIFIFFIAANLLRWSMILAPKNKEQKDNG